MRETLRGALLSVLFFGLMTGGAPTTVRADDGWRADHRAG